MLTRSASEVALPRGPTATGMDATGCCWQRTIEINGEARSSAATSLGKTAVTATVVAGVPWPIP